MELKQLLAEISAECRQIVAREALKLRSNLNPSGVVIDIRFSNKSRGRVRKIVENLDIGTCRKIAELKIEKEVPVFLDEIYLVIDNKPDLTIHFARQVTGAYAADLRLGNKSRGYARLLAHGLPPERLIQHCQWLLHLAKREPKLLERVLHILFTGGYWLHSGITPQVDLPWEVEYINFPASQTWAKEALSGTEKTLNLAAQEMVSFLLFCQRNEAAWQQEIVSLTSRIEQEAHRALRPDGEDFIALDIKPVRFTDGFEWLLLLPKGAVSPLDIEIGFAGAFWGQPFQWTVPFKAMADDRTKAYQHGAANGWHCCHLFRWLITKTLAHVLIGDTKEGSGPIEKVGQAAIAFRTHEVRSHARLLPYNQHPNPSLVAQGRKEMPYYGWDANPNATYVASYQKGRVEGTQKPVARFTW